MAEIPHPWGDYARLQSKLSMTTAVAIGNGLEAALNIIHQPDFCSGNLIEGDMLRLAANAARQERHRNALLRQVQAGALDEATAANSNDDGDVSTGASSLDNRIHARRELLRIADHLHEDEWYLLSSVAEGVPYEELAIQQSTTSAALRSQVCRLRRMLRGHAAH